MIVDQVIGRSFIGVLQYAVLKSHASLVFSTLASDKINLMAYEFISVCEQKQNVSRSVAHNSYSPNLADNMTDEQVLEFIKAHREGMGFGNTPYVVVKHMDTDKPHYHVIQPRIDYDGLVVSDKNNYNRNERLTRKLEKEFGLTPTERNSEADKRPKHHRDRNFSEHEYIKNSLDTVLASSPTFSDFNNALSSLDIESNIRYDKQGKPVGISFKYQDYSVSGTKVGYKLSTLKNKGINYEPARNSADTEPTPNPAETPISDRLGGNEIDDKSASSNPSQQGIGTNPADHRKPEPELSRFAKISSRIKSTINSIRDRFKSFGGLRNGVSELEDNCQSVIEQCNELNQKSRQLDKAVKQKLDITGGGSATGQGGTAGTGQSLDL